MANTKRPSEEREPGKGKLYREVTSLNANELYGLVAAADRFRCSKPEIIGRASRGFLGIQD